jgi:hypothetical protein
MGDSLEAPLGPLPDPEGARYFAVVERGVSK